jgi:hypothetical protein
MNKEKILIAIDEMIAKSKQNGALTDEEAKFFSDLKKRTEKMDEFFTRLRKNAAIKKKR